MPFSLTPRRPGRRRQALLFISVLLPTIANVTSKKSPANFLSNSGPIHDALCNVEDLEQANDSQLYTILQELRQTAFFRSFVVDLDERCPITTWSKPKAHAHSDHSSRHPEPKHVEILPFPEDGMCTGLPDMDPDAEPACSVDDQDPFPLWQTSSFSAPPHLDSVPVSQEPSLSEDDSEFDCDGGDQDLDDDAEPLCSLTEDDFVDSPTPIKDMIYSALRSLSFGVWESEAQKRTFSWSQNTDPVVLGSIDSFADADCEEPTVPDTFWMDMCSNIKAGDTTKLVNLALNPERNTGYNGTHIWRAIYEENCIQDSIAEMCYEERVLYRLLSGLHTSTTLSIAKNYYAPSKRKGRDNWEPNPQYFMDKFEHNPEYIRNLHFSYLVLLRALQKASPFLHTYEIRTGNILEDETATILLRRLLDSTILRSCQSVFTAFDESVMFKEDVSAPDDVVSLRQDFKGVFHNISSILDCVQCQQCKLHGKMSMLGYGTALKILFLSENRLAASLERNEIVALINTIAKFSESIREVRELTQLYWEGDGEKLHQASNPTSTLESAESVGLVDMAVGIVSSLAREGRISDEREAELVHLVLARNSDLLALAKHYANDPNKFLAFSESIGTPIDDHSDVDVIVIGSGLAGLSTALNVLDRGGKVVIIEKEHLVGGNSNKASSGINGCCPETDSDDFLESFKNDTIKSAGDAAQLELIDVLVNNSADALMWLRDRVGVDLSLRGQLGGHSYKRTHRPRNGMVGAEIIYNMHKAVRAFEKSGMVKILVDTRVTKLLKADNGRVVGVEYESAGRSDKLIMNAANVVLATGGFASDRSEGSYLATYRPELLKMPATAGNFSTGDGIALASALGAGTVDMAKVQLHPTGWVDPNDPSNPSKILAAELIRGVGGILLNGKGKRFCNELGDRAYVTDQMLAHDPYYAKNEEWKIGNEVPTFWLVLSSSAALDAKKHVDLYTHKGLLTRLQGVSALAVWMGQDVATLRSTFIQYQEDANNGTDKWGKTSFKGVPLENLDEEIFHVGTVTPVLHYCMGGITIDSQGSVLDEDGKIIPGLHAAGEVTGGVHGNNRLGGNSLLECTVYGSIVGKKLNIRKRREHVLSDETVKKGEERIGIRNVTIAELELHNTPEDCWVAIHGNVYDLTAFADEHPAGAQSIHLLAGKDGTEAFEAVHNEGLLLDFEDDRIGVLAIGISAVSNESELRNSADRRVSQTELMGHNTTEDCWVAFHGDVYDMTRFAQTHPGGSALIQNVAGTDGTEAFSSVHKKGKLKLVGDDKIGMLMD